MKQGMHRANPGSIFNAPFGSFEGALAAKAARVQTVKPQDPLDLLRECLDLLADARNLMPAATDRAWALRKAIVATLKAYDPDNQQ